MHVLNELSGVGALVVLILDLDVSHTLRLAIEGQIWVLKSEPPPPPPPLPTTIGLFSFSPTFYNK